MSPASIPSPPANGFHAGPLYVHAYGVAYAVAVVVAVAILSRRWEAQGGDRALVHDVALWAFPAGLIGGRLYFVATSWDEVGSHWWSPLAIWQGGLGVWGGIAAGVLVGVWRLRRHCADVALFLDAAAPALLVAQAIGRIGNYFNQELFGGPTSLPWGLRIDLAHRPAAYVADRTFHPTFLYELLWDLALAAALVWLGHRRRVRPPGLFALYVAGYSLGRIGEELLRVDPAHHILGLRLNFFVAGGLFAAGCVWFVASQRPRGRTLRRGGAVLAAGGAILLAGCGGGRSTACAWPCAGAGPAGSPEARTVVSTAPARRRYARPRFSPSSTSPRTAPYTAWRIVAWPKARGLVASFGSSLRAGWKRSAIVVIGHVAMCSPRPSSRPRSTPGPGSRGFTRVYAAPRSAPFCTWSAKPMGRQAPPRVTSLPSTATSSYS
jgi:prolipoprotein diacylglyceryl transferase